jgi:hypothetical protein
LACFDGQPAQVVAWNDVVAWKDYVQPDREEVSKQSRLAAARRRGNRGL